MNDNYQTPDISQQNPLQTEQDKQVLNKKTQLFGLNLPQDPKMKLLLILGAVIVVLLVLSLFTTKRRTPRAPSRVNPTPTSNVTPIPTEISDITKLPDGLKEKFQNADNQVNSQVNFAPPQIDTEVGL